MRALVWIWPAVTFALAQGVLAAEGARAPSAAEIAAAYAAIPHARTLFDAPSSTAPAIQKAELARLFAYTDRGVVLRVQGMQAHSARNAAGVKRVVAEYDGLIADLGKEKFTPEVASAQALIVEALQLHQRHFQSRPEGGLVFVGQQLSSVPDVREANRKLMKAYDILMRAFPGETKHNKSAFFDHLCALDFL
jgi:hypothetical protein